MDSYSVIHKSNQDVADLDEIAMEIKGIMNLNDDLIIAKKIEQMRSKHSSLLSRIFKSRIDREKDVFALDVMKNHFQYRLKMMEFHANARLEAARIIGDAMAQAVGIGCRTKMAKIVKEKIDEMNQHIMQSRSQFMERIKPHADEIEKYREIPWLYDAALRSIQSQVIHYMDAVDKLLDGFIDAMTHKASVYMIQDKG
jgi:hypothetical protein